jgi:hypothetical protein
LPENPSPKSCAGGTAERDDPAVGEVLKVVRTRGRPHVRHLEQPEHGQQGEEEVTKREEDPAPSPVAMARGQGEEHGHGGCREVVTAKASASTDRSRSSYQGLTGEMALPGYHQLVLLVLATGEARPPTGC